MKCIGSQDDSGLLSIHRRHPLNKAGTLNAKFCTNPFAKGWKYHGGAPAPRTISLSAGERGDRKAVGEGFLSGRGGQALRLYRRRITALRGAENREMDANRRGLGGQKIFLPGLVVDYMSSRIVWAQGRKRHFGAPRYTGSARAENPFPTGRKFRKKFGTMCPKVGYLIHILLDIDQFCRL